MTNDNTGLANSSQKKIVLKQHNPYSATKTTIYKTIVVVTPEATQTEQALQIQDIENATQTGNNPALNSETLSTSQQSVISDSDLEPCVSEDNNIAIVSDFASKQALSRPVADAQKIKQSGNTNTQAQQPSAKKAPDNKKLDNKKSTEKKSPNNTKLDAKAAISIGQKDQTQTTPSLINRLSGIPFHALQSTLQEIVKTFSAPASMNNPNRPPLKIKSRKTGSNEILVVNRQVTALDNDTLNQLLEVNYRERKIHYYFSTLKSFLIACSLLSIKLKLESHKQESSDFLTHGMHFILGGLLIYTYRKMNSEVETSALVLSLAINIGLWGYRDLPKNNAVTVQPAQMTP